MVDVVLFLLVMVFGSSTWMTINAIWVELSLYTNSLPEGWTLPSYLAAFIQVACLLTLVYSIAHRFTRFNAIKAPLIFSLLIFASASMFLLAFFWDRTSWVFGGEHSTALIALTFCMALVCAASNMFFLPYMAALHPTYMTAYFVGMSFSSLVPSLLKIIQGVGNYTCVQGPPSQEGRPNVTAVQTEPLFPVKTYNLLIFAWMFIATVAFAILHWKFGRDSDEATGTKSSAENGTDPSTAPEAGENEQSPLKELHAAVDEAEDKAAALPSPPPPFTIIDKGRYWMLIFVLSLTSAEMNTIVPSIHSYATLAYSNLTYHLALTLSNISHPIANFLPLYFKPSSLPVILALASTCTVTTAFIFLLALQSPDPLLRHSYPLAGSLLSIGASILVGFLSSYLRTHLTGLIRREHRDSEAALFWCGFFMQIGSFLGACVMFPLVSYAKMFRQRQPCSD